MDRNLTWRALVVALAIVVALVCIFPTLVKVENLPGWWKKILPSDEIKRGLDLQGGMHLVLEVQTDEAVASAKERTVEELKFVLRKEKIPANRVELVDGSLIEVQLARVEDRKKLDKILDDEFRYLVTQSTSEEDGRYTVSLDVDPKEAKRIKDLAVRQALETIRNRIDQFGVSEPDIRPQGTDRLIVQLPDVKDPERAKKLIGQTARLEFKLVDDNHSVETALADGPPPGTEIAYEIVVNRETGRKKEIPFLLRKRALMTGEYVTDARVAIDNQFNEPYVTLNLDAKGARLFERVTEAHTGKRLAVVLDGVVKTAPVIQEKIGGGRARITGQSTMEEARDLAIVLRAGALMASVKPLEERTVGPSLGDDSIAQGRNAIILGLLLVMVFMVVYYRASGVIADVALCLNLILIMGSLALFKATLTLPGIAGILLTIGMSVDANVLIFERIREEIRLGKTPRAAVDGGFGKAMWTILDANVTTLIAAIVLFQFGTGPIRGFAVTLSVGIVASLFTAIFVSRLIFDILLAQMKLKTISV